MTQNEAAAHKRSSFKFDWDSYVWAPWDPPLGGGATPNPMSGSPIPVPGTPVSGSPEGLKRRLIGWLAAPQEEAAARKRARHGSDLTATVHETLAELGGQFETKCVG